MALVGEEQDQVALILSHMVLVAFFHSKPGC